jgi:hypothetical protein
VSACDLLHYTVEKDKLTLLLLGILLLVAVILEVLALALDG